jgi:hypothetical protein
MKSIDVKGLLKSHFPRKYHVLDRHEQPTSLGAIYWRDNSILARWNQGKYNTLRIDGSLESMDENIMVVRHYNAYFWTRFDSLKTKNRISQIKWDINCMHGACIVDSTAADPTIAFVSGEKLTLIRGDTFVSQQNLKKRHNPHGILCCNNKLYIDEYIYTLDEQLSSVCLPDKMEVLEVSPFNNMYISRGPWFHANPILLWSANQEKIGHVLDSSKSYNSIKFLDEYRVAAALYGTVDICDIRKMKGTIGPGSTALRTQCQAERDVIIDAVNQRFLPFTSSVASVWDLNTGKWTGGFYTENQSTYSMSYRVNTRCCLRYLRSYSTSIDVLDFAP